MKHLLFMNSGMASKLKKRGRGEGKKAHHQAVAPGMPQLQVSHQPQTPALQPSAQLKPQKQHSSPATYMPPPVTALEPSQLLENPFDPLAHFVQPLMHLPHHANDSPSPAPPHLNAHPPGGPVSPETHPFLNQHPILPSPGEWKLPVYYIKSTLILCTFRMYQVKIVLLRETKTSHFITLRNAITYW